MRVALAMVSQEQSTFNPVETQLAAFQADGLWQGRQLLENAVGHGSLEGFLAATGPDSRRGPDIEVVPIVHASAVPAGRIAPAVYRVLREMLETGLRSAGRVDAVALSLHGACSATGVDDVDGELIAATRQIVGPLVPIIVGLDHHANITNKMVGNATAIIGHRTQPHDPYDTGARVGEMVTQVLDGSVRPVISWRKLRLISHQEQYLSAVPPMKIWFDRARAFEQDEGVLAVSPFPMQPWLDVEEGGWAVVAVTDANAALGDRVVDEMADLAWSLRAEFQRATAIGVPDAVARAADGGGLVILSDTGDSVFGGAAGDSTVILRELLRSAGIRALVPLVDPRGTAALRSAGVGAAVDLQLGGSVTGWYEPVRVRGTVLAVGEPVLHPQGYAAATVNWGPVAVVEAGGVIITVSEIPGLAGNHPAQYEYFGLHPADFDAVVLKTASNFQYQLPTAPRGVIRVDTPGPTQSDIASLPWSRIPRPIYPLDQTATWRG